MTQLLTMLAITILPKNYSPIKLTDGLTHEEFKCHCKKRVCHYTLVSNSLIEKYRSLRLIVGVPFIINSGYRCQSHNLYVGGVEKSSHTTGHAIDISTKDVPLLKLKILKESAKSLFDYVKVYDDFIHCQINE